MSERELLDEKLERLKPLRIILRKDAADQWVGLTEESWNMAYSSKHVYVYWTGQGSLWPCDAIKDAEKRASESESDMVFDPFSDECPIIINWRAWLEATTKFDRRNAQFGVDHRAKALPDSGREG